MKIDERENQTGEMKHSRAAKLKLPLFDGESGRTNSLKEVQTQQTAAVYVPAMSSAFLNIQSSNNLSLYTPLIQGDQRSLHLLILLCSVMSHNS